jgi:hypothetical protein
MLTAATKTFTKFFTWRALNRCWRGVERAIKKLQKSVENLSKISLFFHPQMSGFAVGTVTNPGSIPTSASSTFIALPLHRHNVIIALLKFRCSKSELFNSPNSILPQCD